MTADQQQMREPLLMELAQLRRQVAELEAVEAQRRGVQVADAEGRGRGNFWP